MHSLTSTLVRTSFIAIGLMSSSCEALNLNHLLAQTQAQSNFDALQEVQDPALLLAQLQSPV